MKTNMRDNEVFEGEVCWKMKDDEWWIEKDEHDEMYWWLMKKNRWNDKK